MLSHLEYDTGAVLQLRLRDKFGRYYDFSTTGFVASETVTTRAVYTETPSGNGTSLYTLSVTLPNGGPFVQEAVLPTGEVIASDTADDTLAALSNTTDPLGTVVVGSNPPVTRGEAIDRLFVMASLGPIAFIPVNTDPDTQHLHIYGRQGDASVATGKTVYASATSGQVIGPSLVSKQKLTATLNSEGYAYLSLIKGIEYSITADWWGTYVTITVTSDADKTIASYVAGL